MEYLAAAIASCNYLKAGPLVALNRAVSVLSRRQLAGSLACGRRFKSRRWWAFSDQRDIEWPKECHVGSPLVAVFWNAEKEFSVQVAPEGDFESLAIQLPSPSRRSMDWLRQIARRVLFGLGSRDRSFA